MPLAKKGAKQGKLKEWHATAHELQAQAAVRSSANPPNLGEPEEPDPSDAEEAEELIDDDDEEPNWSDLGEDDDVPKKRAGRKKKRDDDDDDAVAKRPELTEEEERDRAELELMQHGGFRDEVEPEVVEKKKPLSKFAKLREEHRREVAHRRAQLAEMKKLQADAEQPPDAGVTEHELFGTPEKAPRSPGAPDSDED
tara:strand:- start:4870 stop:5460 length:591 start_codon:yes stop_codon:yes gene_type:complete